MSQADEIRSALLGSDDVEACIVEHKGHKVEVRAPSLAQQRFFTRVARDKKTKELDGAKMTAISIIACSFIPGTDQRVFKDEDEEVLMNKSTHPRGIVGKISRELQRMMKETVPEVEEDFEEAP